MIVLLYVLGWKGCKDNLFSQLGSADPRNHLNLFFFFRLSMTCDSSQKLFFLFPKEVKLSKDKSPHQKDNLVKGKDKQQVKHCFPKPTPFHAYSQKVKNRFLDKKNSKSGQSKNNQDQYHLSETFQVPFGLEFLEEGLIGCIGHENENI